MQSQAHCRYHSEISSKKKRKRKEGKRRKIEHESTCERIKVQIIEKSVCPGKSFIYGHTHFCYLTHTLIISFIFSIFSISSSRAGGILRHLLHRLHVLYGHLVAVVRLAAVVRLLLLRLRLRLTVRRLWFGRIVRRLWLGSTVRRLLYFILLLFRKWWWRWWWWG